MKKTHFEVRITNGGALYTAYEGVSKDKAYQAVDTARALLVLSGGRGIISLSENGGHLFRALYEVEGHYAKAVDYRTDAAGVTRV